MRLKKRRHHQAAQPARLGSQCCCLDLFKLSSQPVKSSTALAIIIIANLCLFSTSDFMPAVGAQNTQPAWTSRQQTVRWTQQVATNPPRLAQGADKKAPTMTSSGQTEIIVGAGSNVTLSCSARGQQPLTFVWFQDEKNQALGGRPNSSADHPATTKVLEERRYEISEEIDAPPLNSAVQGQPDGLEGNTTSQLYLFNLKQSDTGLFLCWVENTHGYAIANFSLIVNDSPPARLTNDPSQTGLTSTSNAGSPIWRSMGLSQSEAQLGFVTIGFVIVLIAGIMFLLMFKHTNLGHNHSQADNNGDIKSNNLSNQVNNKVKGLKASQIKHLHAGQNGATIMYAHPANMQKLSQQSAPFPAAMVMSDSDQDDDCTISDEDGSSVADSSSSCNKSPTGQLRVMAPSDLDNFFEHMRSGIINMDYHSMSPVIQFNNNNNTNINNTVNTTNLSQQNHVQQAHLAPPSQQPNPNFYECSSNMLPHAPPPDATGIQCENPTVLYLNPNKRHLYRL